MGEEQKDEELRMYDPSANKVEYKPNVNMYNPNEPGEKIVDRGKLAQTLGSIGDMLDSIPEDAMLEMVQMVADGMKFKVAIEYPKIVERLYRERTMQIIKNLQECL